MSLYVSIRFDMLNDLPQKHEKATPIWSNPLMILEAATGFEPVNNGFADRCLTTWLCRRPK
jgi:hypothetical protein